MTGLLAADRPPAPGTSPAASRTGRPLAVSALVMAGGVLAVSISYAAGRAGSASPAWDAAYWLGEMAVFAPVAWRVLARPEAGESEAAGLAAALAAATYLIKFLYSPAYFAFPDELQHWRTTANLLSSHHLFGANPLLPVSPVYPGLAEATSAVVTVTGLPVFPAGLIVAGASHLLLTVALYAVFRQVGGTRRIALAACAVYATNPHYAVFDAIFGYQTIALAFFGLALVAALRLTGDTGRSAQSRWWAVAAMLVAATVVSHHVTSYMLAGALILLAVVAAVRRARGGQRGSPSVARLTALAAVCVGLIAAWIAAVAPVTVSYMAPTARDLLRGLAGVAGAHAAAAGATPASPLADRLASYAATATIMVGVPLGWREIWRTQRERTWALALGLGAGGYYLIALIRVTAPHGGELAGRGLTFVYIPVAYTLAMALAWLRRAARRRRTSLTSARGPAALIVAVMIVLLVGGLASGWPPYWERLPGRYVVDGFESGITRQGVVAANWTRAHLGPGNRIAADFTNDTLLGAYGHQDVVNDAAPLFCGPSWTVADASLARRQAVRYLMVDLRMTDHAPPPADGYFSGPPAACPTPVPRADLAKFATLPATGRLYDGGNIIVYALPGVGYAP